MAHEGRVQGRISEDRQFYELVQNGEVRQRIPIADAHSEKMQRAIARNGWETVS